LFYCQILSKFFFSRFFLMFLVSSWRISIAYWCILVRAFISNPSPCGKESGMRACTPERLTIANWYGVLKVTRGRNITEIPKTRISCQKHGFVLLMEKKDSRLNFGGSCSACLEISRESTLNSQLISLSIKDAQQQARWDEILSVRYL
jgi:hypothetical protein